MSYYLPFGPEIELGQQFGWNPNNGINPAGGHTGDDWKTQIGTPVYAAGDGEVIFCGQFDSTYADNFGWNLNFGGNMVILNMDGADGPYFEYGHLSEILVNVGDRVTGGQVIALTGNTDGGTGVSTGPHCHIGCLPPNFNINSNTYGRVNPRIYMTEYYEGDDDMSILDEPIQQVGGGTITLRQQLAEYRPHHIEITNKLDVITEQTHESMLNDRTQVYALQDVLKNASPVDIAEALNAKQIAREVMDEISKIISA